MAYIFSWLIVFLSVHGLNVFSLFGFVFPSIKYWVREYSQRSQTGDL